MRFGVFEFDLRSGELRKQGRRIRLEGQPVQVLIKLLERSGELVTRVELKKELWPADTFVNFEQSLNAAVKRLRQALGDSPANPRFVETLTRRGYRFIAPVDAAAISAPSAVPIHRLVESLAVLPFGNTDSDPETEYLADGITESIINHVSRVLGVAGDGAQHRIPLQGQNARSTSGGAQVERGCRAAGPYTAAR